MPPFRRIYRGEPFQPSEADYNGVMDMARQWYGKDKSLRGAPGGSAGSDPVTVRVRNTSDDDLDVGECLSLTGVLTRPDQDQDEFICNTTFLGVRPAAGDSMLAVAIDPIAHNEIGRMVVVGVVPAYINVVSTGDTTCGPTGSSAQLASGSGKPIRILWKNTTSPTTGEQWVAVMLGNPPASSLTPAILATDLWPGDSSVFVHLAEDQSDSPIEVDNGFLGRAGKQGDRCLMMAIASQWQYMGAASLPYSILFVQPHATNAIIGVGFDAGPGNWTSQQQSFLLEPAAPAAAMTSYANGGVCQSPLPAGANSTTAISVDNTEIVYGQPLNVGIAVTGLGGDTPTPSGSAFASITTSDGAGGFTNLSNVGSGGLVGGSATIPIFLSNVGDFLISGQYAGDTYYNSSAATAAPKSVTVDPADVEIGMTAAQPNGTAYGNKVQLYAIVAVQSPSTGNMPFTGAVSFYDGATLIATRQFTTGKNVYYDWLVPSAGTHTITARFHDPYGHYTDATSSSASVTVTKASLAVLAANASRPAGQANPAFTATMQGLVIVNQTLYKDLTGQASFSCFADANSAPGTYAIVPSLGTLQSNNYSFDRFVDGTLTVNPAS